jgi:protein-S-isoprenylcysteine O-methyltransferase Ste14
MNRLLLRIPVPWVFVLGYLIGVGIEQLVPVSPGRGVPGSVTFTAGVATFVIGMALAAWGWTTFYRARTTTVPGKASSSLVTWGPYVFSRNPMYLGLAIAYLGEALIQRQIWPALVLPLVIVYVSFVVIPLEEAKLVEVFGARYTEYRLRVRRWV